MKMSGSIIWSKAERFLFAGGISSFLSGFVFLINIENISPFNVFQKSGRADCRWYCPKRAGFYTVWGSSSNSASAALKGMIHRLRDYRLAVHILDGPRGPAGVVKPGAIAIAHGAKAVIVPSVIIADRAWYLHSWDRFMIPKPFSRVTVKYFPKIELPPEMDKAEFENQRKKLEDIMQPYLRL
jgi:hypothetical protein